MNTVQLTDSAADQIPKLGVLVWYEVPQIDPTYDECEDLLGANGFDASRFPKPTPKKAYHFAVNSYRKTGHKVVVTVPQKNANAFHHQITIKRDIKTAQQNRDAHEFEPSAMTTLDKATGEWKVTGVDNDIANQELEAELQEHFDRYMERATDTVLRDWTVYEFRRLNVVSARTSGGIWFVPAEHAEAVSGFEKIFSAVGAVFYSHPVYDTATWRTNAAGFVEQDLGAELLKLQRDLQNVIAESKAKNGTRYGERPGDIRAYKLETCAARFKEFEKKALMYKDLLSVTLSSLTKGYDDTSKLIARALLGEVDGLNPTPTAAEIREEVRAAKRKKAAARKAKAEEKKSKAAKTKTKATRALRDTVSKQKQKDAKPSPKTEKVEINLPF